MSSPTNKTWSLPQIRHELSYKQDMIPPTNNWGYRRIEYRFHEEIERKSQHTRNSECRFDIQDHLIIKANIIHLFTWSKCCHQFILCWRTILLIFGNHLKLPVFVPIFCIEGENDNRLLFNTVLLHLLPIDKGVPSFGCYGYFEGTNLY